MTENNEPSPKEVADAIAEDLLATVGAGAIRPGQMFTKEPGQEWQIASVEEGDEMADEAINEAEDCEQQRTIMSHEILRTRAQRDYEIYCNDYLAKYIVQLETRNRKLTRKLVYRARGIGETRKRLEEVVNPGPGGFLAKLLRPGRR